MADVAFTESQQLADQATAYLLERHSLSGRRIGWMMIASIFIEAWDLYTISFLLIFLTAQFHPSALLLGLASAGTQAEQNRLERRIPPCRHRHKVDRQRPRGRPRHQNPRERLAPTSPAGRHRQVDPAPRQDLPPHRSRPSPHPPQPRPPQRQARTPPHTVRRCERSASKMRIATHPARQKKRTRTPEKHERPGHSPGRSSVELRGIEPLTFSMRTQDRTGARQGRHKHGSRTRRSAGG